eukprot:gene15961-18975_t
MFIMDDEQHKRPTTGQESNVPLKRLKIESTSPSLSSFEIIFHFQAHESEVIEIRWCKGVCSTLLFVSTCVSSSKLWRFSAASLRHSTGVPAHSHNSSINNYKFTLKKSYEHEEIFNINSISLNSDGQTFVSSDEFRVYLWDLNNNQECFNIIDLKPSNIQLLNEIIRVTEFHPIQCNYLVYGTSRGSTKLCDMRISALCNDFSRAYEPKHSNKTIFSDYMNSILDLRFSDNGRYFVTRCLDSLTVLSKQADNQEPCKFNQ